LRNHGPNLLALDTADFAMIRRDAEHRNPVSRAKFPDVVSFTIKNDPANSCPSRGSSDLGQRSRSRGLEDDGIRSRGRGGLNDLQQLLALVDRIVVRIDDLQIGAQPTSRFLGRCCLLDLIVVVVGGK